MHQRTELLLPRLCEWKCNFFSPYQGEIERGLFRIRVLLKNTVFSRGVFYAGVISPACPLLVEVFFGLRLIYYINPHFLILPVCVYDELLLPEILLKYHMRVGQFHVCLLPLLQQKDIYKHGALSTFLY